MNVDRMRRMLLSGGAVLVLTSALACGARNQDEGAGQTAGAPPGDAATAPAAAEHPAERPADQYARNDSGTSTASPRRATPGAGRGSWDAPAESTSQEPARTGGTLMRSLPAGQELQVVLLDDLSSAVSKAGDSFRARVTEDVFADGSVAIPSGTVVRGTVVESIPLNKKIGGRAKLVLDFDRIELPSGENVPVGASFEQVGKSETAKDAATIAGATAGGAILGRILKDDDRQKGTLIGAVVGAATGTAIAARTEGQEVQMVSGTPVTLKLTDSVTVPVRL